MENGSKKRGRPKAQPQTGPLVLEGDRAYVKMEIEMPEETADELKEYARWVELSSSVATKDALVKTVDFALRDVFKRDRLWQEQRKKPTRSEPSATAAAQAQAAPAASLPSPASSARPVPSPSASPGIR